MSRCSVVIAVHHGVPWIYRDDVFLVVKGLELLFGT